MTAAPGRSSPADSPGRSSQPEWPGRASQPDVPAYRAPVSCPVCDDALVVTGLGCRTCGTQVSGEFRHCEFCSLSDDDLATLRSFLTSRGNMRELAVHLGVSYPTARQRYAEILGRLGWDSGTAAPDRDQVLVDLAAGRLTVDEAEALLRP
ncbi:MAG: DUF2089 domain-containing protein [Actinomycetota bacterium]|nr:MAG: DUF2089 domain-containing protein [Actinomycetota bacterium]